MQMINESDPIKLFSKWYEEAKSTSIDKPNAMSLSTADSESRVSSRLVLLSRHNAEEGFVFHTNYLSRKCQDIESNSKVALLFWWDELGYQIRIEGQIQKTDSKASDEYFSNRPRGSQLGAWASEQSQEIESRQVLEERMKQFTAKYDGADVPRPPHWGGYAVLPDTMEFWLNCDDRLHDRVRYDLVQGQWQSVLLAP